MSGAHKPRIKRADAARRGSVHHLRIAGSTIGEDPLRLPPYARFAPSRGKSHVSALHLFAVFVFFRGESRLAASLLETAREALESVPGSIRVVCNSGLQPQDVVTARAAAAALRQEWCGFRPEELLWEDPSPDAVQWVEEEFYALWTHHAAVPLAEFVIEDIARLSRRVVVPGVKEWTTDGETPGQTPAAAPVRAQVQRIETTDWESCERVLSSAAKLAALRRGW